MACLKKSKWSSTWSPWTGVQEETRGTGIRQEDGGGEGVPKRKNGTCYES